MATPEGFRVKRKRVSGGAGAKRKRADDDAADAADAAAPAPPAAAAKKAAAPTPAVVAVPTPAATEPAAKKRAAAATAAKPAAPAAPAAAPAPVAAAYPTAHVSQPVVWEQHPEKHINLQRFFEAVINAEVDACRAAFTGADAFVADELETALSRYKAALIDKMLVPSVQALRNTDANGGARPNPRDDDMRAKLQLLTHLHDKVVQETAAWDALKLAWEARAKAAAAATTTAAAQSTASSASAAGADPLSKQNGSANALRAALSKDDLEMLDTNLTGALQNDMEHAFKAFSTRGDRLGLMLKHMEACVSMAQSYKDKIAAAINAKAAGAAGGSGNTDNNPVQLMRTLMQQTANGAAAAAPAAAGAGAGARAAAAAGAAADEEDDE